MATAVRRHSIVNPARRKNKARRRNPRKRKHLSAKQIRYFGTAQQRAALKRKRRHNTAKTNRRRNAPKAQANRRHRRRNAAPARARNPKQVNRKRNRARANKRRHGRRNPGGEILVLPLANPARRSNMKTNRRRRRNASASRSNRRHHRRNPGKAVARQNRHHRRHHHTRRRNPGLGQIQHVFMEGLAALGGVVGSRLLTQAVLGSQNVGAYGYAGNAAATAVLAGVAHMMFPGKPEVRDGIIIGGAAGIIARAMQDFTPFGSYLTQAGFGDYGAGGASGLGLYLPSNAVTPARYIGDSATVEMPAGWAPTTVVQAAGVAGYGRSGRYSRY